MKQKMINLVMALLALPMGLFAQTSSKFDPRLSEVWSPMPPVVTPGATAAAPPSDAIILFDGTSTQAWRPLKDSLADKPIGWTLSDGALTVVKGAGNIITKDSFTDVQLHIEWRTPTVIEGTGQGRGNSGIFLQSRYELQVLDNFNNQTYPNGQAGSIYKQSLPFANACRPPGEWQTYDIIYTAPRFNEAGRRTAPARITVLHNGVLVQHETVMYGSTEYDMMPKNNPHGAAPIMLQDHSNPVSYRNIWVRRL